MAKTKKDKAIVVDYSCQPQFDKDSGKTFLDYSMSEFENKVNEIYIAKGEDSCLKSGYADFCKHLFVENFVGAFSSAIKITSKNIHLLRSEYHARAEKELPVLVRFFNKVEVVDQLKAAKYLDIILYSREQIAKENKAMGIKRNSDAPWGIVSIKPQDFDYELPMNPITIMRNALGKKEGGSGIPLNRDEYLKSVAYWQENANVF